MALVQRAWAVLRRAPGNAVQWLAAILAIALCLRATRLMSMLPIMIDETIYLRWAGIIQHQGQWFISLLDGKTPLCFWVFAFARTMWPSDPLLACRIVSVATGLASTVLLFALGRRLAGDAAGLIAALLYAVMPYGTLYDRIAYTDGFVNLAGIAIAYTSVACFHTESSGKFGAAMAGLALGLGYFAKPTALLFAFLPVAAALCYQWGKWSLVVRRLAVAYGVAACFPLLCLAVTPPGPEFNFNSIIFHHTTFFSTPVELLHSPLENASANLPSLLSYLVYYATLPLMAATIVAMVFLLKRRYAPGLFLFLAWLLPVGFQIIDLKWFPSRYVFPHMWACIVPVAAAYAIWDRGSQRWPRLLMMTLAGIMALQSALMVARPRTLLQPDDASEHLGSGPFSGAGIREAVEYLGNQARQGARAIITEPVWGPPSDAIHAYLSDRDGIRVFDGWWLQLSSKRPVVPRAPIEFMKSQYERVAGGTVDFSKFRRIYFVTATNYERPKQVYLREPGALLVARFFKPNRIDSVDVYLVPGR